MALTGRYCANCGTERLSAPLCLVCGANADATSSYVAEDSVSLHEMAIRFRRRQLAAVAIDPLGYDWPDGYMSGKVVQGKRGVPLATLADALGCAWQSLKPLVGKPIGLLTSTKRASIPAYDPDLLMALRTHPAVFASRERRAAHITDRERVQLFWEYYGTVRDYRLHSVRIDGFRSIHSLSFAFDPLTILLGKNGAGKTSILSALSSALLGYGSTPLSRPARLTLALRGGPDATGPSVDLIAACLALGLPADHELLVTPICATILSDATLAGAPNYWHLAVCPESVSMHRRRIEELCPALTSRTKLLAAIFETASHVVDTPEPVLSVPIQGPGISVTVLKSDAETLGQRLLTELAELPDPQFWSLPDESDYQRFCEDAILRRGDVTLPRSDREEVPARSTRIGLEWESDTGELTSAAHAQYLVITGLSVDNPRLRVAVADPGQLDDALRRVQQIYVKHEADTRSTDDLDRAIDVLAMLLRRTGPSATTNRWFSTEPLYAALPLAHLLAVEEVANELAPSFINEEGRILLLPPQHVAAGQVGVGLLDQLGNFTPQEQLPSGVARWVGLLTELALDHELALAKRRQLLFQRDVDIQDFPRSTPLELAQHLKAYLLADRESGHGPSLLIADEPELHLHPSAQEEIVKWCLRISDRWTVVVATHAAPFLRLSPGEGKLIRVVRTPSLGTRTDVLEASFLASLDEMGQDLGLGRERILQLTRGFVVVEGLADKRVLETFGGDMLRRLRLAVVPIHGHLNAAAVVNGEFALALGLPIAAVFDDVTSEGLELLSHDSRAPDFI